MGGRVTIISRLLVLEIFLLVILSDIVITHIQFGTC